MELLFVGDSQEDSLQCPHPSHTFKLLKIPSGAADLVSTALFYATGSFSDLGSRVEKELIWHMIYNSMLLAPVQDKAQ